MSISSISPGIIKDQFMISREVDVLLKHWPCEQIEAFCLEFGTSVHIAIK